MKEAPHKFDPVTQKNSQFNILSGCDASEHPSPPCHQLSPSQEGRSASPAKALNHFSCLMIDRALTKWEQITVGGLQGGFFRPLFRPGWIIIKDGQIELGGVTDAVAGFKPTTAATLPLGDVVRVSAAHIPVETQIRSAVIKSILPSVIAFVVVLFLVFFKGNVNLGQVSGANVVKAVVVMVLLCLAMGFFFGFLPAYLKIRDDLTQVLFITASGSALPIALTPEQTAAAKEVLSIHGIELQIREDPQKLDGSAKRSGEDAESPLFPKGKGGF